MKLKYFFLVLAFFSASVGAVPVTAVSAVASKPVKSYSFDFDKITISDLTKLIYNDILKQNYVLSPDLSKRTDLLNIKIHKSQNTQDVKNMYIDILKTMGAVVIAKDNYDLITVAVGSAGAGGGLGSNLSNNASGSGSAGGGLGSNLGNNTASGSAGVGAGAVADLEYYLHVPKYRTADYLVKSLSPVFPNSKFSCNSQVSSDLSTSQASQTQNTALCDTLVFSGSKRDIKQLKVLLAGLDKPTKNLAITAYLFEVNNLSAKDFAIGLISNTLNLGSPAKTQNYLSFNHKDLSLVVKDLLQNSNFNLLSNPSLTVSSCETANLVVGDQIPFKTSAVLDKNGNPVSNIEYKQSGIQLDVKPCALESGSIDVTINQSISNAVQTDTQNTPTLSNRSLKSKFKVSNGSSLAIGGLRQNKVIKNAGGFSLFPFSYQDSASSSQTELVLMLQIDVLKD